MLLSSLSLKNFRSYSKQEFSFSPQTSLIIGPNASGKTNIIEAVYLLSTGKSFRASKESEMISYGQEISHISGRLPSLELQIILTTGKGEGKRTARKLYKVNGVGKRWRDFSGILKTVIFRPEDIELILGPPFARREYLDSVLEQIDWQYRSCSMAYKKGLRQRNKLLNRIREGEAKPVQLTFWNQLLIKNGTLITQKRESLIDFYNQCLNEIKIDYQRSTITGTRLAKYSRAELALGATLVGPHRDEIEFQVRPQKPKIKERNLALYGSRGEQRMAVFNTKLAELEFVKERTGEQPLLLLDDILSELDKKNRARVLRIIDNCQTVITATEIEEGIKRKGRIIKLA